MRSMIVKNNAVLELRLDNRLLKSIKKGHVQPSEMIDVSLGPKDLEGSGYSTESALEFSIT
jgi:hypothetical protein